MLINAVGYNTPKAFRNGNTLFGPMFIKIGTQSGTAQGSFNACDLVPVAVDDVEGGRTGKVPDGKDMSKAISMQKLTATGGVDGDLLYWLDYEQPGFGPIPAQTFYGWYTGAKVPVTNCSVAPGEGLWVDNPSNDKCSLCFPSVLNK